MRITRVTTKVGDGGETFLGDGRRVGKDSLRIEASGSVDELSSQIGMAVALGLEASLAEAARRVQDDLFRLGADLTLPAGAGAGRTSLRIEDAHVARITAEIGRMLAELAPLREFVLPGGAPGAACLHVARTVCRRAERVVVALSKSETIGPEVLKYLNRLSDWLFVAARTENRLRGTGEILWRRDG